MFYRIEASRYRSLWNISQRLGRFHILVGPNASGKSSFLDVIQFLSDMVRDGDPEQALDKRAPNWRDLVWRKKNTGFALAVEARIPDELRPKLERDTWTNCRYQVRIGIDDEKGEVGILRETLILKPEEVQHERDKERQVEIRFPGPTEHKVIHGLSKHGTRSVVNKTPGGNDNFYDESGKGFSHAFKLGPKRSALANVPEDESKFPVSTWFKHKLQSGVVFIQLNGARMRKASPPGRGTSFRPDGSNLPWVVRHLKQNHRERFDRWIEHLQTYFPQLTNIDTVIREDDRHCYLKVRYDSGLTVPSWGLSDGTLRMFALTILAYQTELEGTLLIEEPENGIHPQAIETVYDSLSSVYDAQILLATHSPVFVSLAAAENLLCFAQTQEGKTDVIAGPQHPKLQHWRRETNLSDLFAGGVLG